MKVHLHVMLQHTLVKHVHEPFVSVHEPFTNVSESFANADELSAMFFFAKYHNKTTFI